MIKALVALLFLGCGLIAVQGADRSAQIEDIREATFRYQFTEREFGPEFKVYFLALQNGEKAHYEFYDPEAKFMKRFAGNRPRVAVTSTSEGAFEDVRDRKTHEKGVIFFISSILWISENEVEVTGGFNGGGDAGFTYGLTKKSGKWIVVKSTQTLMS